jgi:hypothetical protein
MTGEPSYSTVADALQRRERGDHELIVNRESPHFYPGRWQFEDIDDLTRYLSEAFGIDLLPGRGLRGTISRRGNYTRLQSDGTRAFTFGDPVLDQITSPNGEIVIGNQAMNLAPSTAVAADLVLTGDELGVERWDSPDGSKVEYRSGAATLTFQAFTDSDDWDLRDRIGVRITTKSSIFDAANIDSRYYLNAYAQTCAIVSTGRASHRDDDHVDQYEWAVALVGELPQRVEALCRAQWNGDRYSAYVSTGRTCSVVGPVPPFPQGWPDDWPPDTGLTVTPRSLYIPTVSSGVAARGSIVVRNLDPYDAPISISEAEGIYFQSDSGPATVPANGNYFITVTFLGIKSGTSSIRITAASGQSIVVPIFGIVENRGPAF